MGLDGTRIRAEPSYNSVGIPHPLIFNSFLPVLATSLPLGTCWFQQVQVSQSYPLSFCSSNKTYFFRQDLPFSLFQCIYRQSERLVLWISFLSYSVLQLIIFSCLGHDSALLDLWWVYIFLVQFSFWVLWSLNEEDSLLAYLIQI